MNRQTTLANFFKELLQVLVLTTLVGIVLSVMLSSPLERSLTYSLAIGLDIFIIAWVLILLRKDRRKTFGIFLIAIPLGSIVGVALGSYLLGTSLLQLLEKQPQVLLTTAIAALAFGTAISYYFYARSRIAEGQHQLQAETLNRAHNEQRLTETELRLLQAQIEPHFLFNTLSNVVSLIDNDPQNAKQMLENLTHYLRASLQRTRTETTTLGQEAALLKTYLAIQTIRMGERLRYKIDIPPDLHKIALPPLIIQPLVENAVKHGIEPSLKGGSVLIKAKQDNEFLFIEVQDTGQGMQTTSGSSVGLHNIQQRLHALYGEKGCLRITENQPHGVIAALTIPLSVSFAPEKTL